MTLYWKVTLTVRTETRGEITSTHDNLRLEEALALIGNYPDPERIVRVELEPSS